MADRSAPSRVIFPMAKGPYQDNGASPWSTSTSLGTPAQMLKFALDTGTNILWSTSSLCTPTGCQHYSGGRFLYEQSTTFDWIDKNQIQYSFGPWGTMTVETGKDVLGIPGGSTLPVGFYLSAAYDSPEFAEIDWDGGIGLPSGSAYVQKNNSFIVEELMNDGTIAPSLPYISFDWDDGAKTGSCEIGGFDSSKYIADEGIYMPWTPYTQFAGVEYIWTTPLDSYRVGSQGFGSNLQFCLDSGSSQFKGDDYIMNTTLFLLTKFGNPPVTMGINGGEITVTSDQYMVEIEAGSNQGQVLPQFKALGLTNLVLVGSVLMEYCYTIFVYGVVVNPSGRITLAPKGMYAFNKPNGPKIITRPSPGLNPPTDISPRTF